jgi:hypothetical protein
MRDSDFPRLILPDLFDERAYAETPQKGSLIDVICELEDGRRFTMNFYDPVRFQQDLESETERSFCFAEPGLVILPEVTVPNAQKALKKLYEDGYFDRLCP